MGSPEDGRALLKTALGLESHPANIGQFREKIRGKRQVTFTNPTSHDGVRDSSSSIYFMLEENNFIGWHKLLSDEFFYWHSGGTVKIHLIDKGGNYSSRLVGDTLKNTACEYFGVIPHDTWYAAEIDDNSPYVLYSAVVTPGWDIRDRTEGKTEDLLKEFPQHAELIEKFANR